MDAAEPSLLVRSLPDVLVGLGTTMDGLTDQEAHARLDRYGPNELAVHRGPSLLTSLVRQLIHPLALLLWLAATLSFLTGAVTLGVAILLVIALNAALALLQERHAEHAVAALSAYLPPHALVVRDGRRNRIEARAVVPGDLVVFGEGDAVCADAKILSGAVEVDLSAVTGESVPVVRAAAQAGDEITQRLLDSTDVLLSGTTCTTGDCLAVAVETGMGTELGRIAGLSGRTTQEPSPLERQVRRVAWLIAAVAVGVGLAFLPLGVLAGLSVADAAVFAIGLLVANVPEGLLPTITLALAVGVADLARRGGLVKRLSAVETLGSTDVICTDKTGTLTQNRMSLHSIWDATARHAPDGPVRSAMAHVLRSCTTADPVARTGDPTELALLDAASSLATAANRAERRDATYSFDPRLRLMSVVVDDRRRTSQILTKGAPEAVLARSVSVMTPDGEASPLSAEERDRLLERLNELAGRGLRIIACAQRELPPPGDVPDRAQVEQELVLIGFAVLSDPLRDAVPDAVEEAHRAGITIHVITGDNGGTASAIAASAGIGDAGRSVIVTGTELEAMDDTEVDRLLASGHEVVFARSAPEDKLRIADRLQHVGHVVAMTGDGVNDAPALRKADIGVAMGRSGTDVAREAATMVLTDDDFATIIRAVQAGRRVYDNVRKFILYIFAHAVPEIVPFLFFALSGGAIPLGLTIVQILMIDLGTETLPALALGREAAEPGLMSRPPRDRRESIITGRMLVRAWAILGVTSAALVMAGFLWVLYDAGWRPGDATGPGTALHDDYLRATTMTFAGIVACQIGTAMAARTDHVSLLAIGVLSNRLLLAGIAFEVTVTAAAIYLPAAQSVLGTRPLHGRELAVLASFPVIVWGVDELYRWVRRTRRLTRDRAGHLVPNR
ncbi:cation-translocating P-type ATPase [Nocardioides soli]|uniref:Calcium-translocating P-type ATPase n=1 Tax=Nocardioides soli TaxID=1036020 RepID=A0A7W4Z2C7_9ACTN|nr:cation-transporting P-type ATPase [Nocardioides soli]MBB3043757.1 calcium-translocating P-type ATPase [Nocardioides soli]